MNSAAAAVWIYVCSDVDAGDELKLADVFSYDGRLGCRVHVVEKRLVGHFAARGRRRVLTRAEVLFKHVLGNSGGAVTANARSSGTQDQNFVVV